MTDGATIKIDADEAGVSEENGVLSVGFADSHSLDGEVDSYVVFQRTVDPTEEDRFGAAAVYLELGDQSRSGYGIVQQFVLNRNRARIVLSDEGARKLAQDTFIPEIRVQFDVDDELFAELERALRTIVFKDADCYVNAAV